MENTICIKEFCNDYQDKENISIKEMENKYGLTKAHITNKAKDFGLKLRRPKKNWV